METIQCVLYARVSTTDQAEKQLSIPAQLEAMRHYAASHGWRVVREFLEPGASARTAERPSLQALLAMVRDAEACVGVVLVHKIDRLARNVYDHATIRAALEQRGIRLVSCTENLDDSVSGQLVENIMASIAQFYSANLSEEVKKGMKQKVLQGGWPHRPPRGYALLKSLEGNKIVLHQTDAALIAKAFELYATGWWSLERVSGHLASEGLLGRTGRPLSQSYLRGLLSNPFYVGKVRWRNVEAKGTHSPLIPQELFDKVQKVLQVRYRNPGYRGSVIPGFPLRGLAVCASCGGRMTAERHGKWRYYRCSRQTYRRSLCSARFCNADKVEADLERVCRPLHIDQDLAAQILAAAKPLIEQVAMRQKEGRRSEPSSDDARLEQELTEAFTRNAISSAEFNRRVAEIRARRETKPADTLKRTPKEMELGLANYLRVAQSLWGMFKSLPEPRRASLLQVVFAKIVLDHSGIAGYILRSPFDQLSKTTEPTSLARAFTEAA